MSRDLDIKSKKQIQHRGNQTETDLKSEEKKMEINEKIDDREANLQYTQKGITSLSDLEKEKGEEQEKSTGKCTF